MSEVSFYRKVLEALEDIGVRYMLVGAFAGLAFGVNRVTFDVDLVVDLQDDEVDALAARFPLPRYYADPHQMRDSIRLGIMFNLIDTQEGAKADLIPLPQTIAAQEALARRVRQPFVNEDGTTFEVWCASPADVIIGKLQAWSEGQSAKHPTDIYNMLIFSLSGMSDVEVDVALVTEMVTTLDETTAQLWEQLLERARRDVRLKQTE